MSEIKIEKKKPVWPWFLLVLVLLFAAFAAWLLFIRNDNTEPLATAVETAVETADETALIDVHENNNIVTDYITFIDADTATMNVI